MAEIKNRYDFVLVFDVKDGNPNGDPDGGNMPRLDPETGHGLVTDVCLKRKIRNFVILTQAGVEGRDIFVKERAVLNRQILEMYESIGAKLEGKGEKKKAKGETVERGQAEMCRRYYDIRTFGAVMSTGANAGQVRGPVQLTFARSVDPIVPLEHSITRMAVANEADADKERTMGRKNTVPYGLYMGYGFVSPGLARQTGFSDEDLTLLWQAIQQMFEHDRSAARGLMSLRKLLVFRHAGELGNAPSHRLFDMVSVKRKDAEAPARSFDAYEIAIAKDAIPAGVEFVDMSP